MKIKGASFSIEINPQLAKLLEDIEPFVRHAVMDKCMPAMVKPIIEKAESIAPSSRRDNGLGPSRDRWSKKYKNNPKWAGIDSGKHIGYKLRKYAKPIIFVGAKHPLGNKQMFLSPQKGSKVRVEWGKRRVMHKLPVRDQFMRKAYDETITQQHSAFLSAFQRAVSGGVKIG